MIILLVTAFLSYVFGWQMAAAFIAGAIVEVLSDAYSKKEDETPPPAAPTKAGRKAATQ